MNNLSGLLTAHNGMLVRAELASAAIGTIERALRRGDLVAVLPGIYVEPVARDSREVRLRAAMTRYPAAVACGPTAAALTFWPDCPADRVHVVGVRVREPWPGFCFSRRSVKDGWIERHDGIRLTAPALTAVEMADSTDGESIDRALRSRAATLAGMNAALDAHPSRAGNHVRRRLLLESRDEPWSPAERLAHTLLRRHRICGWTGSRAIRAGSKRFFPDLVFPAARLCVEIDGRAFHDSARAFEEDRLRQNAIIAAGWTILRFTWAMLTDEPDYVIGMIRTVLAMCLGRSSAGQPRTSARS